MDNTIDIVGAIFALGIVFWLAGGTSWLEEKTRQMKLDNDRKELENQAKANELGLSITKDD